MYVTLYNVISQDGYVADGAGEEDFISDSFYKVFLDECSRNDVVVFGKNTHSQLLEYPKEFIDTLAQLPNRKIILTTDTSFKPGAFFEAIYSLDDFSHLQGNVLVSSSHKLNDVLIRENLVDEIITNVVPQKLGAGIPQFTHVPTTELTEEKVCEGYIHKRQRVVRHT